MIQIFIFPLLLWKILFYMSGQTIVKKIKLVTPALFLALFPSSPVQALIFSLHVISQISKEQHQSIPIIGWVVPTFPEKQL